MSNKQSNKSRETKKNITECSIKLFFEKGFTKTTVREIVEAAGVAHGTFYLYFESKDQVLYRVLEKTINSINSILDSLPTENPIFDDLDKIIDSIVEYMEKNQKSIAILHNNKIIEIMDNNEGVNVVEFSLDSIEEWIINAGNKGVISKKDPSLYSKIIFKITHEILEEAFLFSYPENIEIIQNEVKKIIRNILL